jgi:hypothetical protein
LANKKVAGTVILHLENGLKRFLMHQVGEEVNFIATDYREEKTGLANILEQLRESVQLDITKIDLVDLTNGQFNNQSVPLFVFETQEENLTQSVSADYQWVEPETFRQTIKKFSIEGMPIF